MKRIIVTLLAALVAFAMIPGMAFADYASQAAELPTADLHTEGLNLYACGEDNEFANWDAATNGFDLGYKESVSIYLVNEDGSDNPPCFTADFKASKFQVKNKSGKPVKDVFKFEKTDGMWTMTALKNSTGHYTVTYKDEDIEIGELSVQVNADKSLLVKKEKITEVKAAAGIKGNTITWKSSSKEHDGYQVYRSTKKSSGFKLVATTNSTCKKFVDGLNIKKGKTYYYKVRAYVDKDGEMIYSKYSDVKSVSAKKTVKTVNLDGKTLCFTSADEINWDTAGNVGEMYFGDKVKLFVVDEETSKCYNNTDFHTENFIVEDPDGNPCGGFGFYRNGANVIMEACGEPGEYIVYYKDGGLEVREIHMNICEE